MLSVLTHQSVSCHFISRERQRRLREHGYKPSPSNTFSYQWKTFHSRPNEVYNIELLKTTNCLPSHKADLPDCIYFMLQYQSLNGSSTTAFKCQDQTAGVLWSVLEEKHYKNARTWVWKKNSFTHLRAMVLVFTPEVINKGKSKWQKKHLLKDPSSVQSTKWISSDKNTRNCDSEVHKMVVWLYDCTAS